VASEVLDRLPRNAEDHQRLIADGYDLARQMSWEVVVKEYLMPVLEDLA
jgi:hypothetical protein